MAQVTPSFTRDVKQKWIEALRSGLYKQTYSYLNNNGAYCALGILAEVTNNLVFDEEYGIKVFKESRQTMFLPESFFPFWYQAKIAGLNNEKRTFSEIASFIENNIPCFEDQNV